MTVDSTLSVVAPVHALRRQQVRNTLAYLDKRHEIKMARLEAGEESLSSGGFISGSKTRDAHSWLTSRLSPDAALEYDLEEMRARSDSAYKNYELARAHVERRTQRVVGCGITVRPAIREHEGLINKSQAKALNRQVAEALERILPRIGHHGEQWHVIQRMVQRHWEKDGEAFILIGDKYDRMSPITLKLEVIHPRRVETPPSEAGNPLVRMGVVYNAVGDVVGFWVRSVHPGDNKRFEYKHDFIPATFKNGLPRMLHLYDKLEAGQSRGYPHLQVSLRRFKNMEEYEDADLERNIVAACTVGVVKTNADPEDIANMYAPDQNSKGQRLQDHEPGTFQYLNHMEDVSFNNPPGPQNAFVPYMEHQGRMAAAGVGTSYEMMSGNWKGLSYSAAKAIWNDDQIPIDCRQLDIALMLIIPVYQHIITKLVLGNDLVGIDPIVFRSEPWHYWRCRFVWPKKYSLDPQREGPANEQQVAAGFEVAGNIVEQNSGMAAEDVYEAMEQDKALRDEHGIHNPVPRTGGTQLGETNPAASEDDDENTNKKPRELQEA